METRHIKIDYEDALDSKKHLLSSEINLLHILKKIKSYGMLRKRELMLKGRLKIQLNNLRKRISLVQYSLPTEGILEVKKKKKRVVEEKADIQGELEEIRKKLERLE